MRLKDSLSHPGVIAALGAAALFGAGTPLAKLLLNSVSPWMLAGLLYLGSGCGLMLYRFVGRSTADRLPKNDIPWFAGAVIAGGVLAPMLLMMGLRGMPASGASLLLNAEGVFTALLAWFVFKENVDRRIAIGMIAILAGAVILSWPGETHFEGIWPAIAILAACFLWGLDNNLTRKVSLTDATWIAAVKGMIAGSINLLLALFSTNATWPPIPNIAGGLIVGFFAYGISLVLFVVSLRHLGTARTGAYFSIAPFIGAILAVALGEPLTIQTILAGGLMAIGVLLHLTEHHDHFHTHEFLEHEHKHTHDENHCVPDQSGAKHSHESISHSHPHFPDTHHQHRH